MGEKRATYSEVEITDSAMVAWALLPSQSKGCPAPPVSLLVRAGRAWRPRWRWWRWTMAWGGAGRGRGQGARGRRAVGPASRWLLLRLCRHLSQPNDFFPDLMICFPISGWKKAAHHNLNVSDSLSLQAKFLFKYHSLHLIPKLKNSQTKSLLYGFF